MNDIVERARDRSDYCTTDAALIEEMADLIEALMGVYTEARESYGFIACREAFEDLDKAISKVEALLSSEDERKPDFRDAYIAAGGDPDE